MLWTLPLAAGAALVLWQLTLATRGKRPRIPIMLAAFGLVITAGLLHPTHPQDYPRLSGHPAPATNTSNGPSGR